MMLGSAGPHDVPDDVGDELSHDVGELGSEQHDATGDLVDPCTSTACSLPYALLCPSSHLYAVALLTRSVIHYRHNPEALATHSVSVIILSMLLVVIVVGMSVSMMLVSRSGGLVILGNYLSPSLSYIR